MTVKKESVTLQAYRYHGWHSDTGAPDEIIYVDLKNKHPDPSKRLIWGWGEEGQLRHGDYNRFFEKVGKPVKFEFEQTGRYAADEQRVRSAAIRRAVAHLARLRR